MAIHLRCTNPDCTVAREGTTLEAEGGSVCQGCQEPMSVVELPSGNVGDSAPEPPDEDQDTTVFESSQWKPEDGSIFHGKYRVIKKLGKGGMGAVFQVQHLRLRIPFALKIPDRSHLENDSFMKRFVREARAAAKLGDVPGICRVVDVADYRQVPYIIMDFIQGETLADHLRRAGKNVGLPVADAVRIASTVATALHVVHSRKIVHRDLKPANIMIHVDGGPIVMDFGLAKSDGDEQLTQAGDLMGTVAYMPPEQGEGDVDAMNSGSIDIYALGVILFEMLTGRKPFTGSIDEVLRQIANDPPVPPSSLRIGLDPRLDSICLKAMAKSPSERFKDMGEFARALAPLVPSSTTVTPRPKSQPAPKPGDSAHRPESEADPRSNPGPTSDGSPSKSTLRRSLIAVGLAVVAIALWAIYTFLPAGNRANEVPSKEVAIRPTPIVTSPSIASPPKVAEPPPLPLKRPDPPKDLSPSTGMTFAKIPAGVFQMGSPPDEGLDDEQPQRKVEITRDFYLGHTEVTQSQYAVITNPKNPNPIPDGNRPVDGVTWLDAVKYCNALSERDGLKPFYLIVGDDVSVPDRTGHGYRLPTEAEWEYACRAGKPDKFGFGSTGERAGEYAWFRDNVPKPEGEKRLPKPVKTRAPNPFNLYDMQGNVLEWCEDRYQDGYDPRDVIDPIGPQVGANRVLRGGDCAAQLGLLRCAQRWGEPPTAPESNLTVGFRVARNSP